jgi:peptidyl-prolyl cis-trans isomerase C
MTLASDASAGLARLRGLALVAALSGVAVLGTPALAQAPGTTPAQPALPGQDAPASRPAPETLLATVNGRKITQLDVTLAGEDLGQNLPAQLKGQARDAYVLDYLIDATLVAQKAKSDKLDETPDFGRKLVYANDKLLMEAMLTKIAQGATSDATLRKIYDDAAKQQKPEEEIHARHILVANEADAQAALKRLKAGEDFAKVAKEVSKDPGAEGGDLGWFTRERMVPEFADAAFKLQQGQLSDPVKSQFGWHIIQVEGKRQKAFPPFDQVKDQIVRYAMQKAQSDLILELRKTAKIDRSAAAPPPSDPAGSPKNH